MLRRQARTISKILRPHRAAMASFAASSRSRGRRACARFCEALKRPPPQTFYKSGWSPVRRRAKESIAVVPTHRSPWNRIPHGANGVRRDQKLIIPTWRSKNHKGQY